MSQSPAAWTVEIVLPHAALGLFEDRLGELGLALSTFEKGAARDPLLPAVEWVMQVLFDAAPDMAALRRAVAEAAAAAGIPAPPLGLSELPPTDWVSHTNTLLRPLLIVLTLPITLVSLGLFLFVIHALLFWAASGMLDGFAVSGFEAALIGSVGYSLLCVVIDSALEQLFPPQRLN